MAKARRNPDAMLLPVEDLPRPFYRAAMSARSIGVAAIMLGGLTLFAARGLPTHAQAAYALFAAMFILPGLLYVILAAFVSRRRRWAIKATFALASLDMTLLGVVIVTFFGRSRESIILCTICGLFVVALAVLTTFLGRSLDALKRLEAGGSSS
jgi:hypothetical protein